MAVRFRKSDMLGEVLQLMPDLNFAKLNWEEGAKILVESGNIDMLREALKYMPYHGWTQMLFEAGAVNIFGEVL
jgi:hypothetical protein